MTFDAVSGTVNRSLLLVHGRDFKPVEETLTDLSMAALRAGVERDFPEQLDVFDAMQKHVAWYGDLNAEILHGCGKRYDEQLDVGDRRNALNALRAITVRKRFGIRQYDQLPGKSAVPEAIADIAAPLLGAIGLCVPLIGGVAKDFAKYFDRKSDYALKVRKRLMTRLRELLDRGDRIVLVTHGTGSVIAYDVLWQLSHDSEFKDNYADKKVDLWLTLGAPLGDSNIRKRLLGAREPPSAKFPTNLISWHNIAAEDDYTCHDNTLADDFKNMLEQRAVGTVQDYCVYNLAVRFGKSNPHSSIGYLIHPRMSKIVIDWLQLPAIDTDPVYTI